VSVHCLERGVLLKTVFDNYVRLIDHVFKDQFARGKETAGIYAQQIKVLQGNHEKVVQNRDAQIVKEIEANITYRKQIEILKQREETMQRTVDKLKKKLLQSRA